MGISFDEFMKHQPQSSNTLKGVGDSSTKTYVKYFGLNDDGDTAIVRFNVKNTNDILVYSLHKVKDKNNKNRTVECLRLLDQPVDLCPLCASGLKATNKVLVPLVQYIVGEDGTVNLVPCVWEQPLRLSQTLRTFEKTLGCPLDDILFQVTRSGKKYDTNVSYTLIPLPVSEMGLYKPNVYKKDFSCLDILDMRYFVSKRTADDMMTFLTTKEFPNPYANKQITPQANIEAKPAIDPQPAAVLMDNPTTPTAPTTKEQSSEDPTTIRPRRYTFN